MNPTSFLLRWLAFPLVAALVGAGLVSLVGCSGKSQDTAVTSAEAGLWCQEHGVEEKYCVLCHPEILDSTELLLCPEHGNIPEAICTACHPELKAKYEACPHNLPTAFCPQCSPEFAEFQKSHGSASHEPKTGEEHDHPHDHEGEPS